MRKAGEEEEQEGTTNTRKTTMAMTTATGKVTIRDTSSSRLLTIRAGEEGGVHHRGDTRHRIRVTRREGVAGDEEARISMRGVLRRGGIAEEGMAEGMRRLRAVTAEDTRARADLEVLTWDEEVAGRRWSVRGLRIQEVSVKC
jgi:hypothetical protein